MRRNEVRDCQRTANDYMVKSAPKSAAAANAAGSNGKQPSPLSPTNSVCSQVSKSRLFVHPNNLEKFAVASAAQLLTATTTRIYYNYPFSLLNLQLMDAQSSGSATPPCQLVPMQMHSVFQRQNEFFNYLVSCHDLWDQADTLVQRGRHTGKCFLLNIY